MCGLAWRWPISRSVKNACRVGASALMAAPPGRRRAGRRPGRAAPGRRTGTSRCCPGRRGRGRSTAAAAGPATSAPSRYQPSRVRTAKLWRRSCEPGPALAERGCEPGVGGRSSAEGQMTRCSRAAGAGGRDEEARVAAGLRAELVAAAGVGGSASTVLGCSGTSRDLPNFECADRQHAFGEVDVVAVEAEGFADAQPGHREQPDQGLEGGGPQRRAGSSCARRPSARRCRRRSTGTGVARWLRPEQPGGGTSVGGSMACRWRAKPRTTDSRWPHQLRPAPLGRQRPRERRVGR